MELVKGGCLKELMKHKKTFSDKEASTVIRALLSAVEHVHSKNYVHRDLKPENILIDNVEDLSTIKLADFGLSANIRINLAYSLNEKMGTLLFMAPEQTKSLSYGKRIDIWACGIIMYMMIEGKHPLYDPHNDNENSFLNKLKHPQWNLSSLFTPLAKDFFFKMCTISPIQRYTSDIALEHPWITRDFNAHIPLTQSEQIHEFQSETIFRNAINMTLFLSIQKLRSVKSADCQLRKDMEEYLKKCKRIESGSQRSKDSTDLDNRTQNDEQESIGQNEDTQKKQFSFDIQPFELSKQQKPSQFKRKMLISGIKRSQVNIQRDDAPPQQQQDLSPPKLKTETSSSPHRKKKSALIQSSAANAITIDNNISLSPPTFRERQYTFDEYTHAQVSKIIEKRQLSPDSHISIGRKNIASFEFNLHVMNDQLPQISQNRNLSNSRSPINCDEDNHSSLKNFAAELDMRKGINKGVIERQLDSTKKSKSLCKINKYHNSNKRSFLIVRKEDISDDQRSAVAKKQTNNSFNEILDNITDNGSICKHKTITPIKIKSTLQQQDKSKETLVLPSLCPNPNSTNRRMVPIEEWSNVKRKTSRKSCRNNPTQTPSENNLYSALSSKPTTNYCDNFFNQQPNFDYLQFQQKYLKWRDSSSLKDNVRPINNTSLLLLDDGKKTLNHQHSHNMFIDIGLSNFNEMPSDCAYKQSVFESQKPKKTFVTRTPNMLKKKQVDEFNHKQYNIYENKVAVFQPNIKLSNATPQFNKEKTIQLENQNIKISAQDQMIIYGKGNTMNSLLKPLLEIQDNNCMSTHHSNTFHADPDQTVLDSINFEYVANENINDTNISQSTKNKFKKSFATLGCQPSTTSNIEYIKNKEMKQIPLCSQKPSSKQPQAQKILLEKLRIDFEEFKKQQTLKSREQEQTIAILQGQIKNMFTLIDSAMLNRNYQSKQMDPKETTMSQRFEKIISPIIQSKHVKQASVLSPESQKKTSHHIQNMTFDNVCSQDPFKLSRKHTSILNKTAPKYESMIIPHNKKQKSISRVTINVNTTISDSFIQLRTPQMQSTSNGMSINKKNLFEYNKELLKSHSLPKLKGNEENASEEKQVANRKSIKNLISENIMEEDCDDVGLVMATKGLISPSAKMDPTLKCESNNYRTETDIMQQIRLQTEQMSGYYSLQSPQKKLDTKMLQQDTCNCVIGSQQTCSHDYCKNISPKRQRNIVMKLLNQDFTAYIFNSTIEKKQMSALDLLKANIGNPGERKYLISAKWWQQWCDYVNFNNYKCNETEENGESNSNVKGGSTYARPDAISNSDLLLNNQSIHLREHLIENFDYIAVPQIIWKHLYSWYSADWCISRNLVRDSLILDDSTDSKDLNNLTLDLYPNRFDYL